METTFQTPMKIVTPIDPKDMMEAAISLVRRMRTLAMGGGFGVTTHMKLPVTGDLLFTGYIDGLPVRVVSDHSIPREEVQLKLQRIDNANPPIEAVLYNVKPLHLQHIVSYFMCQIIPDGGGRFLWPPYELYSFEPRKKKKPWWRAIKWGK